MKNIIIFLTLMLLCLSPCYAQTPQSENLVSTFDRAYPLGMGGAWRALAKGADALSVNPAGLTLKEFRGISFNYNASDLYDSGILSASFYDGSSKGFSMGLTFDRNGMNIDSRSVSATQLIVGLAKGIGNLSLGLSLKYIYLSRSISSGGNLKNFTSDIGATYSPIPLLSFAAVVKNIFAGTKYPEIPLLMGYGAAVIFEDVAKLSVDVETDFSTRNNHNTNFYFGGEVAVTDGVLLRSGFGLDRVRENPFFGLGLGFYGERFSLNFTFAERIDPLGETYALSAELAF